MSRGWHWTACAATTKNRSECPAIVHGGDKSPFSPSGFCARAASAKLGRMRARLPLLLSVFSLASLPALPAAAEGPVSWRLDTVHTQIQFSIDHQGFNRSLGLFKLREGALQFDEKDWSSARLVVSIDTASLILGDAKWEQTIRSWRFLDTDRWPLAQYRSTAVERGDGDSGVIHGELTLHGRTRPLDIAFRLNKLANDPYTFKRTAGFSATATLKRSDFGMDKVLSAVGDEVQLRLEVAAVRDRDASPDAIAPATENPAPPPPDRNDDDGTEKR